MNVGLMLWPGLVSILTPVVWLAVIGLVGLVVADGIATGRALDREERVW